jgi:DNA polymerase type B, organellar and viral
MIHIVKSKQRKRNFLVYDLEWVPGTLEVRVIGVYDDKKGYRYYRTLESFLAGELTHSNRGRWFYAHAGGLADVQFVYQALKEYDLRNPGVYSLDASFSSSSAIIVKVRRGKQVWVFVDSYWLLRAKLKDIGEWIGQSKGLATDDDDPDEPGITDDEFERRLRKRKDWYANVDLYQLVDYNENDCTILHSAISQFQETLLSMKGQLQMTLASCAMQLFRRRYLTQDIATYDEINIKMRESYFASRVEVFDSEMDNGYYFDINSSFPFAMKQACPGQFAGRIYKIPDNDRFIFFTDCEIEVRDNYITPMPVRMKGRVFFPSGKWRALVSSVDLELLQREGGRINKVYETFLFHPFYDLANYAQDIYDKRKNSENEFEKVVYKLLLNSLYGKFAESPYKTKLLMNPPVTPIPFREEETSAMKMEMLYAGVWLQEQEVSIPHMSVAISSHITALARKTLYECLIQCREIHYCDTDGFSTTEEFSTGKELGELKLEKIVYSGKFLACKYYSLIGRVFNGKTGQWEDSSVFKAKGMSRLNATRFLKLLEGGSIEFERMSRLRENNRKQQWKPREQIIEKRMRIKSIYAKDFDYQKDSLPKRFTYPDGTTRPWHIDELNEMVGHDSLSK